MGQDSPLQGFFTPRGVAVFGSMQEGWFFGAAIVIRDLLAIGYPGGIYPVHPTSESVCGQKVYRSLEGIAHPVDLAVIVTSFRHVPEIVMQCARKGIRHLVVVSDGFGESGAEGRKRQAELLSLARGYGMRIIGPNTLGIFDTTHGLTTVPYERGYDYARTGGLSIVTQTGMYGPQAVPFHEYSFGINKIIDLGNMCDIDETDCLEFLGRDENTQVISLYMEHTRCAARFLEVARAISAIKPILCLKGGRSPDAASALASHTGSLAGDDALYDGLLRQAGIMRVEEYEDLFECAKGFLYQPLPQGNRLGIVTLTGAMGIQCIDAARENGLTPGQPTPESVARLRDIHPSLGAHPVDLGPPSAANGASLFDYYRQAVDTLMQDPGIDCLYVNVYVTPLIKPALYEGLLGHMRATQTKPIVMWAYGTASESIREFSALAEGHAIPCFTTTRKALLSLGCMVRHARWKRSRLLPPQGDMAGRSQAPACRA